MSEFYIPAFIEKAAERTGFYREFFREKEMPTVPSNIVVISFFGDLRATFLMSTFILKPYVEQRKDKYFILCSWPGLRGMFPYVDEYWSINEEHVVKDLALGVNNFYNTATIAIDLKRGLLENFSEVLSYEDLKRFYNNGFERDFWDSFGEIRRYFPEVPSASKIGETFKIEMERSKGHKVLLYPVKRARSWQKGRNLLVPCPKAFWESLIERLLSEGFSPVIYQNYFTFDMSREFTDRCIYIVPRNVTDVFCAMRYVGCVLDVYSGISRLAIAARTPFVCVDERARFMEQKDYEMDDLCCEGLPKQYIFSFSSMLLSGGPGDWKTSVVDNIIVKLKNFMPELDFNKLPSTQESETVVSYNSVRKRKAKRMGVPFIRSSKER